MTSMAARIQPEGIHKYECQQMAIVKGIITKTMNME